jgi:alcohol dehydrogenase
MLEVRRFIMPAVSLLGPGALKEAGEEIKSLGYKKGLIVTDKVLNAIGIVSNVTDMLVREEVDYAVYDSVQPNPTMKNVHDGLEVLEENNCDFIISLGGGSPQDTAKGIGILSANGGHISEYEGTNQSKRRSLPIIAINTTAGTASEVTINYVITNEETHIKMVMVDKNCLATVAVSDPELMTGKPADLTAATGMDALTHAIEAYLSTGAFRLSDTLALESIRLIGESLKSAVDDGLNIEARSKMAWASFIAGMAFNNCGLGYVHSMAHQLGGKYDLPHGVCNAILLPHVERFNAPSCGSRLKNVAEALNVDTKGMTNDEANESAIKAIEDLNCSVGIPSGLRELGVLEADLAEMSENALKDVCRGSNPREVTFEDTMTIFRNAL